VIAFGKNLLKGAAGRAAHLPGNRPVRWAGRKGAKIGKRTVKSSLATNPGSKFLVSTRTLPGMQVGLAKRGMFPAGAAAAAKRQAIVTSGRTSKSKPDFFPRISAMSPRKKKVIGAATLAGIGVHGFTSGLDNNRQVSGSVYDLAFGDPNYDEYVMGRKMGVRSLIAPLPGETRIKAYTPRAYSDAWRANRKNHPRVDGSIAFGMYNSRLG
jgi:hypothetical protein